MTETGKEAAAAKLDALMDSEITRYVDWIDGDKKKHRDKIIVEDPGIEFALQGMDFTAVGNDLSDYAGMYGLVMDHVLDEPNLSYDQLEKDLPKTDQAKILRKKNQAGENITVKMVWPGYRKAFQLVGQTTGTSGALRLKDTFDTLNEEVFRQPDGQVATMDFWNAGGKAAGLGMVAYNAAMDYLSEIVNRDGLNAKLDDAFTFLVSTVRQEEGK